ncbi:hypothetical protein KIPB_001217 [Kipferlia bialata]|uniref:Uncharacterized protein n=1 Tax=Kipferlia bialata TaxID=797122 RepID=A0A391P050_9EUKA|nr:hypothetical protein KIPB_001217 [Kipferlia bialata]|eukprot:g1217.t1
MRHCRTIAAITLLAGAVAAAVFVHQKHPECLPKCCCPFHKCCKAEETEAEVEAEPVAEVEAEVEAVAEE